jgi:phosphatidylglycerophosphate synthase
VSAIPSLAEMRAVNFSRSDPPVYKPLRRISVPLSYMCAKLSISPFVLSGASLGGACLASILLASGDTDGWRWAALAILASYLFDCMDGETARARGVASAFGSQIENVGNWLVICVLQIGAAIGAERAMPGHSLWIGGLLTIAGWLSFYYLYLQLRIWASGGGEFGPLRVWSRALFLTMPLDENLLLVASAAGAIPLYIHLCSVLAPALFAITLVLFLCGAVRRQRTDRDIKAEEV